MNQGSRNSGFTMLELVVVLALFALIATFSLQALSGMLRARDSLQAVDKDTEKMTRTLALLRADMNAAIPVNFTKPDGTNVSAVDISDAGNSISLSVGGRLDFAGTQTTGMGRVTWRWDPNSAQLSRKMWPVLTPEAETAQSPAVIMMQDVVGLEVYRLINTSIWERGRDRTIFGAASTLPKALEIRLTTKRWGIISTKVAYP